MDAADPLLAASSPTGLLRWTLGPAPAASPSKAHEEVLHAIGRLQKGSKELIEQAMMVMKEHGDIRMLYQDDGVKAGVPTNGNKDQQGRRPALDRKRARFAPKGPERNAVPVVDHSKILNITNPHAYFDACDHMEETEKEIKRLNGEVVAEKIYNFEPLDTPKRRRSGLPGRKSVHHFKFIAGDYTQDPIEVPASHTGTMTESQLSQDDANDLVSEKNNQSVPSRSDKHAISDVSTKEDSFSEKDHGADLNYLMASLWNLGELEEEELFRTTLGVQKIRKEKVCLRDSIPGDRPLRNSNVLKSPLKVSTPEKYLPGSRKAQILELGERIFIGDASNDKYPDLSKDDESEGSPDIVVSGRSLVHDSSDVLMVDETFTAREIGRETPRLSVKLVEPVLDPEQNMSDRVDERQEVGSPLGSYRTTEVGKEKAACSRHNIFMEEDNVPIDYPTVDMSNNETVVSSHQLEGSLIKALVSTPGRNVSPDGIARTSHATEDNFQQLEDDVPIEDPVIDMSNNETEVPSHQLESRLTEVLVSTPGRNVSSDGIATTSCATEDNCQHLEGVEEDGVLKDKSSHPLEKPLEDIDPQNQSQMHSGNIKKLAVDLPSNDKKQQQVVKKGKNKQPSKKRQKVSDEVCHPLEIPEANFDSENQPHVDDVNNEQQTVGMSIRQPLNKTQGQKGAQWRNKSKQLNSRKSLEGAGLTWQSGVRRSTRIRSRPLEHWLGERFIIGRLHDTMPTVIGIKAFSPDQDGKKTLKVKSFVSEQYADYVAQGAKY